MTETSTVSASREIPTAATDIFNLLSNPVRHPETDGTGGVRSLDQGDRIKAVGDTFRMNMTNDEGDYQTDNEVFAFVENRVIGWQNLRNVTNGVQVGAKWLWELEPLDAGTTNVTLTYDPTEIDDPAVRSLAKNYDAAALESSLAGLAATLA